MKVEELAPIAISSESPGQKPNRTHQAHKSIANDQPSEIDSEFIKIPSPDRIQLNRLQAANSKSQKIARQIRQVNESMETIDSHLSDMRATLEHIVKIYPPYPPGSTERIEALRRFSALRKMIDQIVRSVGDNVGTNISSAAEVPAGATDLATPSGETKLNLDRQSLSPGQGGLDIPDISADASDVQISEALDGTIAAQAALQVQRRHFIAEADHIISGLS
jgi:methyl-accepting chemotaxis protein